MYSVAMFDFLDSQRKKNPDSVKTIGLFYEDTLFGNDTSRIQKKLAAERGYHIGVEVKYRSNSPSLSTEVLLLKSANPDVILATSYTTDAILFVNTAESLGYKPTALISQNGGFIEPTFLNTVGKKADGVISRASFVPDLAGKRQSLKVVNEIYRKVSNKDLNDNTARELMAMIILADAINRAGKTTGPEIAAALRSTNIPGEKTIMPWDRVTFDAEGQNVTISPVMMQYGEGEYRTVWPDNLATRALKWPMN
jgi:branched-chain amino acid transport system substrate-binding protein